MKTFALVLSIVLSAFVGVAANASVLLNSPTRPTMHEIHNNFDSIKDEAGVPGAFQHSRGHMTAWDHYLKALPKDGPALIAKMEQAYPGATWAFIGRDVMALADMMEAFYMFLGQPDRVVRIGLSSGSFEGTSDADLLALMRENGLDMKHFNRNHAPFIFVDTISRGGGRQGRKILKLLYKDYLASGGHVGDIVTKVNILGLATSTSKLQADDVRKSEEINRKVTQTYANYNLEDAFDAHRIIVAPSTSREFNEMGYEHYTLSWHDSYGPVKVINGRAITTPGALNPIEWRKSILWFQKQIYSQVSQPSFLEAVKAEAASLGTKFEGTYKIPRTCNAVIGGAR